MSKHMRAALKAARKGPLRRIHNTEHGKPPWPAPPSSLAALVRRGWLTRTVRKTKAGDKLEEWAITDAGAEALKPPHIVRREAARRLRVPGGSTRMMQLGTWVDARHPEPEPVHPDDVDSAWFGAALERHAEARDRRERAHQIATRRKAA